MTVHADVTMATRDKPRRIDIDHERLRAIVQQTKLRPLGDEEYELLEALMETMLWLTDELRAEQLSAKRLSRMLFGPSSEKTSAVFPESAEGNDDADSSESAGQGEDGDSDESDQQRGGADDDDDNKEKPKGHGRNPAASYTGAEKVKVAHESLKPGGVCPACQKGKLYEQRVPKVVVRVTGGAPLSAKVYEMQRLRCNLCGEVFTAREPPDAQKPKYDETVPSMIGLLRYGTGLPHNRLDRLQRSVGVPLPRSTQWDLIKRAARALFPIFDELVRQAARGDVMHNDDTAMTVLALTGKRRAREAPDDDPPDRTGMFTTGLVSMVEGRRIALFLTGRQHAGENLEDVLKRRASELGPPIQMCDGLSRNIPQTSATTLANCLSHGRRHIVEVADSFPEECLWVLETLADVFHNDAIARQEHMSDAQRLAYHKKHSKPLMDTLETSFKAQLDEHMVEPNSGLGQAYSYMLKRWDKITLFLRKPGAPLSNNIVERALKRAIIHRNNSLFYRSLYGARVGDAHMSLIYTAELCGANPLDFLIALQRHSEAAAAAPDQWMPWNYHQARARIDAAA